MYFERRLITASEIHPGQRLQLVPFTFCIFGACACSREGWDNWFKSNYETWYSEFLKTCFLALPSVTEPHRYRGMGMAVRLHPSRTMCTLMRVHTYAYVHAQILPFVLGPHLPESTKRVWCPLVIREEPPFLMPSMAIDWSSKRLEFHFWSQS